MVPSSGSCRNLEETRSIPANSCHFRQGLQRNRPEIYTEDGSSFPAGIYPYRNRRHPTDSGYRQKKECRSIRQDLYGIIMLSARKWPETTTELTGCNPTPDFNRISSPIWLLISSGFRIGFHSRFQVDFHYDFAPDFSPDFTPDFSRISLRISNRISLVFLLGLRLYFNRICNRISTVFY
jgi:hypothetical protein